MERYFGMDNEDEFTRWANRGAPKRISDAREGWNAAVETLENILRKEAELYDGFARECTEKMLRDDASVYYKVTNVLNNIKRQVEALK